MTYGRGNGKATVSAMADQSWHDWHAVTRQTFSLHPEQIYRAGWEGCYAFLDELVMFLSRRRLRRSAMHAEYRRRSLARTRRRR